MINDSRLLFGPPCIHNTPIRNDVRGAGAVNTPMNTTSS